MHGMATSGGYMAALGADRIYARQGTITGSIGVILQTAEFTEMAKKLGIEPITVKSGEFKATPSFAEKFTAEQRASIQAVIDSFHGYFKTITAERRGLSPAAVDKISQGQVYSGAQAVELKLVDALGGEKEAIAWLETEKKLAKELPVLDAEVEEEPKSLLEKISTFASSKGMGDVLWRQRGLMAHWQ
jgi:protease-4